MQLKCSQVQKRSKYIGKTVHVTSVAQLSFCDATRILFLHKENKNNIIYSNILLPWVTSSAILEFHKAYAHFSLNVNNAGYVKYVLRQNGGRRNSGEKNVWVNCCFCFLCAKKSILVASQNWSWAIDVTWNVLPMYLLRFWTREHFSCIAVYGGPESALILSTTITFLSRRLTKVLQVWNDMRVSK